MCFWYSREAVADLTWMNCPVYRCIIASEDEQTLASGVPAGHATVGVDDAAAGARPGAHELRLPVGLRRCRRRGCAWDPGTWGR